ncbi:MAG: lipopolysaccharide biosynthesis protein [Planctomycetes bacterium]|nr:lipopolysaccharide biosynthesis protein [Planctomycetota bacterium]
MKGPKETDQRLTTNGESHVIGNLKERSLRGGAITLVDQAFSFGVNITAVIILARLLTPEDYGIVAMVTAITGLVNIFQELGLSSATIQSRDITHEQLSGLFWINAALGVLIMVIIAASGPILAWFYHKPQLTLVTAGISCTSFLSCLGTQQGALLARQMRFATMAIIRVASLVAGLLAAVIVALSGGRYWALVASPVVTALCTTFGNWIASGFRPGLPRRGRGIRPLVRFGAHMTAFDFVNYIHRNFDNVLIGRAWGAEQLGLYNKAYSLLMLPIQNLNTPLARVAFPAMSRLQGDPIRFRSYFIKYCSIMAFVSMPFVAFLFTSSKNVIRLLLGSRWLGAAQLFSILALVAFIQPVSNLRVTVLLALGQGGRNFRWGLYNAIITVVSFFCGLPWGAKGVAVAYCIATYAVLYPSIVYAFKHSPIKPADFYRSLAKPCLASVGTCLITILVRGRIQGAPDLLIISALFLASCLSYLGLFLLLPGGKHDLINYWGYVSVLRSGLLSKCKKDPDSHIS